MVDWLRVESEKDCTEGGRLFVGIGLEIRMDVDDKGGADGKKQACLQGSMG